MTQTIFFAPEPQETETYHGNTLMKHQIVRAHPVHIMHSLRHLYEDVLSFQDSVHVSLNTIPIEINGKSAEMTCRTSYSTDPISTPVNIMSRINSVMTCRSRSERVAGMVIPISNINLYQDLNSLLDADIKLSFRDKLRMPYNIPEYIHDEFAYGVVYTLGDKSYAVDSRVRLIPKIADKLHPNDNLILFTVRELALTAKETGDYVSYDTKNMIDETVMDSHVIVMRESTLNTDCRTFEDEVYGKAFK